MGKQKDVLNTSQARRNRIFSSSLKKRLVDDIVKKRASVRQISEAYDVSRTAVYKWLRKYAPFADRPVRMVVEMESESNRSKHLLLRVAELERTIGQKQLQIDYLEKLLELAAEELGQDLKKILEARQSNGSADTEANTPTK